MSDLMSLSVHTKDGFTNIRRQKIANDYSAEKRIISADPLRAIRKKCENCAGDKDAAAECDHYNCPLWDFRFGTNPYLQDLKISDEDKKRFLQYYEKMKRNK